jgi:hypothetical protein
MAILSALEAVGLYLWEVFWGWQTLALLVLGLNELTEWQFGRSWKALHKHRKVIALILLFVAQAVAYHNLAVKPRNDATQQARLVRGPLPRYSLGGRSNEWMGFETYPGEWFSVPSHEDVPLDWDVVGDTYDVLVEATFMFAGVGPGFPNGRGRLRLIDLRDSSVVGSSDWIERPAEPTRSREADSLVPVRFPVKRANGQRTYRLQLTADTKGDTVKAMADIVFQYR